MTQTPQDKDDEILDSLDDFDIDTSDFMLDELPQEDSDITDTDRYYKVHMREDSAIFNGRKIDFVDSSVTKTNGLTNMNMGIRPVIDNPLFEDYIAFDSGYWRDETFRLYHTTDYLATINNLAEPVTKTPEKTMKVTYVISFS